MPTALGTRTRRAGARAPRTLRQSSGSHLSRIHPERRRIRNGVEHVYGLCEHVYMDETENEQATGSPDVAASSPATPVAATVTVEGSGVSITRPVDDATMSKIIALLFGSSPGATTGRAAPNQPPARELAAAGAAAQWDPDLTLGEFLIETGASTFAQKICAAGYYLIKLEGEESFDRERIKTALQQAHEDMPGNLSRDFATAASTNLIAAARGEAGRYYVPTTGRKAVESHFQEVPRRRAPKRRKSAASSANGDGE